MKSLSKLALCLLLAMSLTVSAFAAQVPDSLVAENLNGQQRLVKTYTLSPEVDPDELKEEDFSYDGYLYTWAYTTKVEHPYLESKTVTETVTVNTAKNDLAQILAELSPSMPYEKDGFSGELALDHTTLSTEASGYTTKYSKTTETKVIGNLDRNDMSYVPATTVKNGKMLTLANVEWQVTGTALVGEALVPAQYQAVATYSASSSYQAATGYEDVYGSRYNYGGRNVVDYQSPELEYGQFSTTQTGVMEKIMLPGLQDVAASGSGIYGISPGSGTVEIPGFLQGGSTATSATPAFTELTQDFLLSNGAVGKISIPAIGVKNYYLWEGETTASMKKGLGHFTSTSVWNGNVAVCGHNRGAKYVIGSIKDLDIGDKITYTTSMGTRTYLVETVTKISSSDWSYLSSTTDNRMTLLTCVAGDSSQRWCVQAVQAS